MIVFCEEAKLSRTIMQINDLIQGEMAQAKRMVDRHFEIPSKGPGKEPRRDCKYCSVGPKRQKTLYRCQQFQIPLCPTKVFKTYHTKF